MYEGLPSEEVMRLVTARAAKELLSSEHGQPAPPEHRDTQLSPSKSGFWKAIGADDVTLSYDVLCKKRPDTRRW